MDVLPEELLADILSRLPPRSLATCRSVCNDWCAAIDARAMLLAVARLVPHRPHGIYINFFADGMPYFFSREPWRPGMVGELDFMQREFGTSRPSWENVLDHRNGLLLYRNWETLYVCNPATQRSAKVPERPFADRPGSEYLMFDPVESLHYDVLFFPDPPYNQEPPLEELASVKHTLESLFPGCLQASDDTRGSTAVVSDGTVGSMAWPPASYPVQVFSSRTGQWEEKGFVRENDTTVTVSDIWSDPCNRENNRLSYSIRRYHAMYWREAFYLHCLGGFIVRFSLQKEKYLVIKTPILDNIFSHPRSADSNDRKKDNIPHVYLGKSRQGIYYTALYKDQLRVWVLHEGSNSRDMLEWELRHQADLKSLFSRYYAQHCINKNIGQPWNLDPCDQKGLPEDTRHHEWDSDNESIVDDGGGEDGEEEVGSKTDFWDQCANAKSVLLGFHPHKEIAFFRKCSDTFAYYLSSSKFQYLGSFSPITCPYPPLVETYESFIYTPCMYDMLPIRGKGDDDNDDEDDDNDDDEDDEDDDGNGNNDDDDDDEEEDEDNDDDEVEEEDDDVHWM